MTFPANLNLDIYEDDDFSQVLRFKDTDGVAIDITDWTFKAEIRDEPGGSTLVDEITVTKTDATDGEITLSLTNAETLALTPGTYYWDLERTLNGQQRTFLAGKVTVKADVTR